MNDDELITAVKESVTGVHMDIPAGQIVSRGRAIRARRRIPALAGALAVAAAIALIVPTLLSSGHQPSHPARAHWPRGRWLSRPTAISVSPSTSFGTRPRCSAGSAPMASRSASPSSASRTRRASPTALAAVRAAISWAAW